jgi:histidyl-tRNA synthetase
MKPSLAKGTRDFTAKKFPEENTSSIHYRRILNCLDSAFGNAKFRKSFNFDRKIWREGDRLIFKILNSGDYASKANDDDWTNKIPKNSFPRFPKKHFVTT